MDFGGNSDSSADNTAALEAAFDSLGGQMGVVCFPEGKFLFKHSFYLPSNTILHGQGSDKTHIFFDLNKNGDFITASGSLTNITTAILSGYKKDSNVITVNSTANFAIGDYALVRQDGSTLMDPASTWAYPYFYQIVKIIGISGNTVVLEKPLRLTFQASLAPVLVKILPAKNAGIECLSIRRLDTTTSQTNNIIFNLAVNCWVKGIESHNANFGHIVLQSSSQCTVSGNYIHDAFAYGGGGQGYGVVLQFGSGENLVYDNIMKHLRHGVLLQVAANGNVVGYNYSREQYWVELPNDASGDIVFHGNYNFTNLVEGNICQNLIIDASHAKNGPYNTFFRNRAEYYGIIMSSGSGDKMNFVGNEITNTGFLLGNFSLLGSNFLYGNNQHGTIIPGGTTTLAETTLIGTPFASQIGVPNTINSKKNAAYTRWFTAGAIKTVCPTVNYCSTATGVRQHQQNMGLTIYPNPTVGIFQLTVSSASSLSKTLTVYNMKGQEVRSVELGSASSIERTIDLSNLSKGEYILIVRNDDDAATQQIIIQ
jgi:hypothetical protein